MVTGRQKQTGFTIVELLIVIVVIAILAAITIVAYNGVQNRAKVSSVQSLVSQAMKKVESVKAGSTTEQYPASKADAGLTDATVMYYYNSATNTYCVQANRDDLVYSATTTNRNPTEGACLQSGLAGWWQLNNNGADASGNGLAITDLSTVTSAAGQTGGSNRAYAFSGSPSALTVPSSAAAVSLPATFSFWVRPTAWNSAAATSFIAKRGGSGEVFIMHLTSGGVLAIDCGNASRWATSYTTPLNQWTHIAVTCTDSSVSAYANGTLIGTVARTITTISNSANFQFGHDATNGYNLTGSMDDIRVYRRALSGSEIQALYGEGAQ